LRANETAAATAVFVLGMRRQKAFNRKGRQVNPREERKEDPHMTRLLMPAEDLVFLANFAKP
jgi:hypothetical protein